MNCRECTELETTIIVAGLLRVAHSSGTQKTVNVVLRGKPMDFMCCRETDIKGWSVELGQSHAGNYASIESFLNDQYQDFPVLGEGLCEGDYQGVWYANYEDEAPIKKCDRWKLYRHEVYQSEEKGSYDAIVVLFYEPANVVDLKPENQLIAA